MTDTIQYKCPACGAHITFDGASQKMKCPYCDSLFTLDEAAAAAKEESSGGAGFESSSGSGAAAEDSESSFSQDCFSGNHWEREDAGDFSVYKCSSCGAELIADATTAATRCPYCDNVVVLSGQVSGELKPDLIIPFKVTREEAVRALGEHFKGKKLLPKVFSSESHLEEVRGVYIPYWLFDAETDSSGEFEMTKVRTWSDRDYRYTETSRFAGFRRGFMQFNSVPVDGLKDLDDDLTESIEGFDLRESVAFRKEYLSGFYANRYDVDSDEAVKRATERMRRTAEQELEQTVSSYTTVSRTRVSTRLRNTRVRYAFCPAWILTTRWRGQTFLFAMNGQTGKFVGNLPMDKGRYWKRRGVWSAVFAALLFVLLRYLGIG